MEGVCVMDVTRPESNVVDKGEERTDCPSFKEYLKTQERWTESSCHSLRRVWTSAFWCYSFHFQTKRRPPGSTLLGRILLGERLGAPCKLSGLPLGLRAASRLWEVRLA